jgi:transcriptional regulator with XRE-family HTH domain
MTAKGKVPMSSEVLSQLAPVLSPERGKRIREIRKKHRISQMELAARIGIDQAAVSRIERCGAPSTVISLYDWCDALESTPEELLGGKYA